MVDSKASTVVIPIMVARTVPHHTIKNVRKKPKRRVTHLRIQLPFPRSRCRRKDYSLLKTPVSLVRSLTVRSKDQDRLSHFLPRSLKAPANLPSAGARERRRGRFVEHTTDRDPHTADPIRLGALLPPPSSIWQARCGESRDPRITASIYFCSAQ